MVKKKLLSVALVGALRKIREMIQERQIAMHRQEILPGMLQMLQMM